MPPTHRFSTDADRLAAHQLLCELRTRISTQRLPYQHGVDAAALKSLYEVFEHARLAMKDHPGCEHFAQLATTMLNTQLRPVTAKWHRIGVEERLASKDGADEFRGDLERLRGHLLQFTQNLQELAYGTVSEDEPTPPVLRSKDLQDCRAEVKFGIVKHGSGIAAERIDAINQEESQAVRRRRVIRKVKSTAGHDAVGLALSGGGIRSATFCLGVVQVLADRGLLGEVDFLSTVSGGGYTGSFLTSELGVNEPKLQVGGARGPDPLPLAKLRAHAKYLMSASLWQSWSRVVQTLAGLVLNWCAPLSALLLLALLAVLLKPETSMAGVWTWALSGLGVLTLVSLLVYGGAIRAGQHASRAGSVVLAVALGITLVVVSLWALVLGREGLPRWLSEHRVLLAALQMLVGSGPAIVRFVPVLRTPFARVLTLKLLLFSAALVIPVTALAVFYAGWTWGSAATTELPWLGQLPGWEGLAWVSGLLAMIALVLVDINQTGPHRLYRDALARTFIPGPNLALTDINDADAAPYHLINTTLNLPSSKLPSIRDRRADFFLFSKCWCGSVATGYHETSNWKVGHYGVVDLKTAMAISGAAAASHMGLLSMPTLVGLITLLNVRLGFWIRKPGGRLFPWPGFLCLLREMLGIDMSETSRWLNLSDGGHLENTGCYELLRRRCKFVIAVDGEADAQYTFGGLLTLIRHVQIDLGIRIDPRLDGLRPNPRTGHSPGHLAFCRIEYPAADGRGPELGLLLYLKLSVTGNESELIAGYRRSHPEFPHQSTLDQFFDQEQFEAYRQLGVHIADGLFSPAILADGKAKAPAQPTSVNDWFTRLASNLLEPVAP